MRPIDADALRNDLHKRDFLPVIVTRAIDAAPTLAIDDLRPKGKWNIFEHDHEFYAECPECKHIRAAHDATEMNFCPCCGMDMGGKLNEQVSHL